MTPWRAQSWQTMPATADGPAGAVTRLDDGATLRVQLISPTLARVSLLPADGFREPRSWAIAPADGPDVPWQGRNRDDLSPLRSDPLASPLRTLRRDTHTALTLSAPGQPGLVVTLGDTPLGLQWHWGDQGPLLAADRATSAYLRERRTGGVRHLLQRDIADRYYGLGDKTGPLNLHGRRLRTLAMDSLGYDARHGDPLYKHWPFVLSRNPAGLWLGLYYDTLATCTFDLGCEHDNYHGLYRSVDIDDGDLDYYVMAGATPGDVVRQFAHLIGGTHLPPRWTLGFAQTAMGLADAPDAQHQLHAFIDRVQAHRVPVSAFHYGSGYSSRGKRRYVFTWNRDKFPDPQALNARFHAHGLNIVANVKPCLLDDHPLHAELQSRQGFVRDVNGQPVVEPFWDGEGSHIDFTEPAAIQWWQQRLRETVIDMGIDVAWNDNNEYAILDENARSAGFGHPMPMHRSRPLHPLLMTRATFEAQQALQRPDCVFTVTRAGPPGIQRYAQTWTGDNGTSWHTLRWNLRTGLQMGLSGLFNVGHDVGGFHGPIPEPELLLRWVQACALNPRMVMNSWKEGGVSNVPWMHPEVTADIIRAIELRYTLLPTLWELFERAHRLHEPIIRPTFFDFPDQDACYEDCDDFMLGAHLLVAPVVEPGQRRRQVYLPALQQGQWTAFDTGERLAGGRVHDVDAPLSRLPLFVRDGAELALAHGVPGQVRRHDDPVSERRRYPLPA